MKRYNKKIDTITFWIVTPSFNQLDWLKLCLASVADQVEASSNQNCRIAVHHHVQDACSTDGTVTFLKEHHANSTKLNAMGYTFSYESVKDEGMYDAINKGWQRAAECVDLVAYLNCDEQYLHQALYNVAAWFRRHTNNDVLYCGTIMVDQQGEYLCHRHPLKPYLLNTKLTYLHVQTCSIFIQRKFLFTNNVFFDVRWKAAGDKVWMVQLCEKKARSATAELWTSAFTMTNNNLGFSSVMEAEKKNYLALIPKHLRVFRPAFITLNKMRRALKICLNSAPTEYAIYSKGIKTRTPKKIIAPSGKFRRPT